MLLPSTHNDAVPTFGTVSLPAAAMTPCSPESLCTRQEARWQGFKPARLGAPKGNAAHHVHRHAPCPHAVSLSFRALSRTFATHPLQG